MSLKLTGIKNPDWYRGPGYTFSGSTPPLDFPNLPWNYSSLADPTQFYGGAWSPELTKFFMGGFDPTHGGFLRSPDGFAWEIFSDVSIIASHLQLDLCWDAFSGRFISVSGSFGPTTGRCITSTNGGRAPGDWTPHDIGVDVATDWRCVDAMPGGKLVACGSNPGTPASVFANSPDAGDSWTVRSGPNAVDSYSGLAVSATRAVACNANPLSGGGAAYSTDFGATWLAATPFPGVGATNYNLYNAGAYSPDLDLFVLAVHDPSLPGYRICTSPGSDGSSWTLRASGPEKINGICWVSSPASPFFFACGQAGVGGTYNTWASYDGIVWIPHSFATFVPDGPLLVPIHAPELGALTMTENSSSNTDPPGTIIWRTPVPA